jgi:hypothetical protein
VCDSEVFDVCSGKAQDGIIERHESTSESPQMESVEGK